MADRGITFSAAMVRALLEGRKTQTRRLLNPQPLKWEARVIDITPPYFDDDEGAWGQSETIWNRNSAMWEPEREVFRPLRLPHKPGDRLYVREHWKVDAEYDPFAPSELPELGFFDGVVCYLATAPAESLRDPVWGRHRQAMHMPRWASRLTLLVTDVRVQRLQDISEADAIAEGIVEHEATMTDPAEYTIGWDSPLYFSAVEAYAALWNSLHTDPGTRWEDNPWIVATSFTVKHGNIDQIGGEA